MVGIPCDVMPVPGENAISQTPMNVMFMWTAASQGVAYDEGSKLPQLHHLSDLPPSF